MPERVHATPETVSIAAPELALGTASITAPASALELESMPRDPEPEFETVPLHPPETVLDAAPDLFPAAVPEVPTDTAPDLVLEATAESMQDPEPEAGTEFETPLASTPEPVLESMPEHASESILEPAAALESVPVAESLPRRYRSPAHPQAEEERCIVQDAARRCRTHRRGGGGSAGRAGAQARAQTQTAEGQHDAADTRRCRTHRRGGAGSSADTAPKPERRRKPRKTGAASQVQDVAEPVVEPSADDFTRSGA